MALENIEHPLYSLYITLTQIFDIDENIIQINNKKNIELFDQDFINIILKTCQSIKQLKKHHLILKIAILGAKNYCLPVNFVDSHLMVGTSKA